MVSFSRHLTSLFCDDIRQEIGGKLTFIGVYNNILYIDSFPAAIPRLGVFLKAIAPSEDAFEAIGFKIWLGENLVAEVPVRPLQPPLDGTMENIKKSLEKKPEVEGGSMMSTIAVIMLSPLNIIEPCALRVRAYDGKGNEYAAPALVVMQTPENQARNDE